MDPFSIFERDVQRARFANPQWRVGQAAFNVLAESERELAMSIRGTSLDPFYDDERLAGFYAWLKGVLAAR